MTSKQKSLKSEAAARRKALRLHGSIARDLGVRIVSGRARPGDILDGEIDASDRLEVSRTAYREAVRILAAKGLVESRPKVGTRVSRPERWHLLDPDVLSWIFEREPDDRLVNGLFELRRIVEPQAAALAAERRTWRPWRRPCKAWRSIRLPGRRGATPIRTFTRHCCVRAAMHS
jgi:DNA-binding FadR family transcriptional regulator